MNINQSISKLLYALSTQNKFYKVNSFQFYSEKNNKYCTKYQVAKRVEEESFNEETKKFETVYYYKSDYECYSKVDLMKYLVEEYREGSEVDD